MVRVTTAAQAAAMDATAIAAGTPAWNLMSAAGRAAAAVIRDHFRGHLDDGCLVFAGPGNNGGDAWVVAADLAAGNASVTVVEVEPPKTDDAKKAKALVSSGVRVVPLAAYDPPASGTQPVIVDGVLGTGATGAPRGTIADAIQAINALRAAGARVIALDIPSGVNATSGATPGPAAAGSRRDVARVVSAPGGRRCVKICTNKCAQDAETGCAGCGGRHRGLSTKR